MATVSHGLSSKAQLEGGQFAPAKAAQSKLPDDGDDQDGQEAVEQLEIFEQHGVTDAPHHAQPRPLGQRAHHDGDDEGDVDFGIRFDEENRAVIFRMADKGVPFDPLKKPDPDITLSADEREIGGLGIFIAKKTMDSITYAYENGENNLTMIKKI